MKLPSMNLGPLLQYKRWSPSRWLRRISRSRQSSTAHITTAAEVEETMKIMSASFHAITDNLEPLTTHTRALVEKSEQLLSLASGQFDGQTIFHDAVSVLHAPLAHVDFCLSRQKQQFELLKQGEEKMAGILACQHQMQEALKPLTYMVVLFKIESAQLPPEQQDTFLTVADEIQRLRELVDSTFSENIETLRHSLHTLTSVREKLSSDYENHGKFVAAHRGKIENAIQTLDEQLSTNSRHDVRLRAVSKDLDNEVGQLVTALQFQDILQQKCEHVLSALRDGERIKSGRWTRVQAAQIQAVTEELEQAVTILNGGLVSIELHTAKLDAASVELEQFDSMTAAADGMVQQLLDNLHDVRELIEITTRLADESRASVSPVLDLTKNLSSTIGEISININHIALNAQVRSVQIGSGSGLEVLAARTADISHELGALGEKTAADIRQLAEMLGGLIGNFNEFSERGQKEIAHLDSKGGDVEKRLHAMRDMTLEAMTVVDSRVKDVRSATVSTKNELVRLPQAAEKLINMSKALLEAAVSLEVSDDLDDDFEDHARTYTMVSERKVHEAALGRKFESKPVEAAPELFFEPEVPVPTATPPTPQSAKAGGIGAKDASPETKAADVGDNVELF